MSTCDVAVPDDVEDVDDDDDGDEQAALVHVTETKSDRNAPMAHVHAATNSVAAVFARSGPGI